MCRTNRRYECEQPQQRRRGPTANIDKDIRGDRSGSTQAAGLITERDAGKQTHSSSAGEAAARLQEDNGGKQIKENRQRAELATLFNQLPVPNGGGFIWRLLLFSSLLLKAV